MQHNLLKFNIVSRIVWNATNVYQHEQNCNFILNEKLPEARSAENEYEQKKPISIHKKENQHEQYRDVNLFLELS